MTASAINVSKIENGVFVPFLYVYHSSIELPLIYQKKDYNAEKSR